MRVGQLLIKLQDTSSQIHKMYRLYSLDYHLIPANSKQEMELSPCANLRSRNLPFNPCQLFLVVGPGNNWPIPVLSDWLRPVLSDWINPAKGVPPRAGKPGKALFNSVNGDHLATLGLGTPIWQGVNCSEIFIKKISSIVYY